MPRLPINYNNSIIYKLCCKNPEITDIYVGSTTDFSKRKHSHKRGCNNEKNKCHHRKVYQFIRGNGGWENFDMIEIEKYEAVDKLDLLKRERYWLEQLKASLNCQTPSRTMKEWRKENRKTIKEYQRKYKEENKEKISKQMKDYTIKNKEKLAQIHKEYRQNNKEKIAQYDKIYQKNNKEKISQRKRVCVTCECGTVVSNRNIARHRESQKHQDYLNSI